MHSLSCITSWLPSIITLCYIDLRFFLPSEQSRMALLAASSQPCEAAHWQLSHHNNYGDFILYVVARQVARCPLMVSIKVQIRCTLKLITILLQ